MLTEKLLDNIRENAKRYSKEILDKASAEASVIMEESTKSSEEMKKQVRLKVRAESEMLRERQYNSVRFQADAQRYDFKSSYIEGIWLETEGVLQEIERSGRYKEILEGLFTECLSRVPDGSAVRSLPENAEIIKEFIEKSKKLLIFKGDSQVRDGVEFCWPDGKTVLKNTLSHRLSRLKAEGNAEISRILFSSAEGSIL